jgi:hypothetical protein
MAGEGPSVAHSSGPSWVFALVLATVVVVLSLGGGAAGYVLGSRSGADLERARAEGQLEGERIAAGKLRPHDLRRARRSGERQGIKVAFDPAHRTAREREIAAGPQACGDARASETPVIVKIRAQGLDCPRALGFARESLQCPNIGNGCKGYSCDAVSTGWEESEITCRSGERTIRWLTGV